jgi:hypothetical protein
MNARALVVGIALAVAGAGSAFAQGRPVLAPAEPPPAGFDGTEWRDSRGCQFVRGTAGGEVSWLPVLDAQRQPVCGLPALAQAAPPASPAADAAPTDALDALARLADTDLGTRGRLVFVEPDNRVRIVVVEMRSVLVGGDPFGVNTPVPAAARAPAQTGRLVGYHPPRGTLREAPMIHGFGRDPEPAPRAPRRAAPAPAGESQVWDGSSPAPLGGNRMPLPAAGPGDDRLALAARTQTAPLWLHPRP